jgi:hypothetical protein
MVIVLAIVAAGSGIYLLGHNLIDAYFRRKEKFVDTLQGKLKGETDGETK